MSAEDISMHEGDCTRSGINRYDIIKSYKIGEALQLNDIGDVISKLDRKFLEPNE